MSNKHIIEVGMKIKTKLSRLSLKLKLYSRINWIEDEVKVEVEADNEVYLGWSQ